MNEFICMVIISGLLLVSGFITFLVIKYDILHTIKSAIKWNIKKFKDKHDK